MRRWRNAMIVVTMVSTLISGLGFWFIQSFSPEIQGWSLNTPDSLNHFGTIGVGVLLIPLAFVCTFVALLGWPALAILTVVRLFKPTPLSKQWERLEMMETEADRLKAAQEMALRPMTTRILKEIEQAHREHPEWGNFNWPRN